MDIDKVLRSIEGYLERNGDSRFRSLAACILAGGLSVASFFNGYNTNASESQFPSNPTDTKVILEPYIKPKEESKIETPKSEEPKTISYKTDDFQNDTDEVILARMIFGEARGCSDLEKTAVAYTALNRAEDGKTWNGETIKEAVLKSMQYSCFNSEDVNLEKLKDPAKYDENSWQKCLEIAGKVKNKTLADPTNGATHYHTKSIHPYWADDLSVKLDNSDLKHIFYRED